jgi:hypothetical protein
LTWSPLKDAEFADGTTVSALALGALPFGTTVDEATSFAILDRLTDAGGTLILAGMDHLGLDDALRQRLDETV